MAIPITGSVNASILPKLNGMPGSTLPGVGFKQAFDQAVQQSQMPLPFSSAVPAPMEAAVGMSSNGFVAAVGQMYGDTVMPKQKKGSPLNAVAQVSETTRGQLVFKSGNEEVLTPLIAQSELPDGFYNQKDPLNLLDDTFEGSLAPPGKPVVSGYSNNKLEITPFQFFVDKAVDFFLRVSEMEVNTDLLMEDYVKGKASLEELMIEKAKTSIAITFSVTLVSQVSQTFKEIQNMQI